MRIKKAQVLPKATRYNAKKFNFVVSCSLILKINNFMVRVRKHMTGWMAVKKVYNDARVLKRVYDFQFPLPPPKFFIIYVISVSR